MIYVGIDVSKDKHDCTIISSDGEILMDASNDSGKQFKGENESTACKTV